MVDESQLAKKNFLAMLVHDRVITIFLLGFSVYIPYFIIFDDIHDIIEQIHLYNDTYTMVIMWPLIIYGFRFVFAPLVDRIQLPFLPSSLGRRRSWFACSQIFSFVIMLMLSIINPEKYFEAFSFFIVLLAIFTSINLILVDAIRIESGFKNLQPLMITAFMLGYQLSHYSCNLIFDAIDKYLGVHGHYEFKIWSTYFICLSIIVFIGLIINFYIKDPENDEDLSVLKYSKYNYYKTLIMYTLCIAIFFFIYALLDEYTNIIQTILIPYGLSTSFVAFLKNIFSFTVSIICIIIAFYFISSLKVIPKKLCATISSDFFTDFFIRFKDNLILLFLVIIMYRTPEITGNFIFDTFFLGHKSISTDYDIHYIKNNIMPIAELIGALFASFIALKIGTIKTLTYGAVAILFGVTLILFNICSDISIKHLYISSAIQYLFFGFSYIAFIGFISIIVSRAYSATQFVMLYILSNVISWVVNNYIVAIVDVHGEIEILFLLIVLSTVIIILSNKVKHMLIEKLGISKTI